MAVSVPGSKLFRLPEDIQLKIVEYLPDPIPFLKTCKTARILGMILIPNCIVNPRIYRFTPPHYLSSIDFYHRTVAALTYRARQLGMETSPTWIELGKFVEQIIAKEHSLKDHALVGIFRRIPFPREIPGPILQPDVTEAANAATIRAWLKVVGNQAFIRNLQGLDLSELGLELFPDEFELFSGLDDLNISGNPIIELTPKIRSTGFFQKQGAKTLFWIVFHHFQLRRLSGWIQNPLDIGRSPEERREKIHAWIKVPENREYISKIKEIELHNARCIVLPSEIGLFTNLEKLEMPLNNFVELSPEIMRLKSLKKLIIYCNNLVSLPREIRGLTALETLVIASNKLKSLPPDLVNLPALRNVSAGSNQFSGHPGWLMRHVEEMDINFLQ